MNQPPEKLGPRTGQLLGRAAQIQRGEHGCLDSVHTGQRTPLRQAMLQRCLELGLGFGAIDELTQEHARLNLNRVFGDRSPSVGIYTRQYAYPGGSGWAVP